MSRYVIKGDTLKTILDKPSIVKNVNIITGFPDNSEMGIYSIKEYKQYLNKFLSHIFENFQDPNNFIIFLQTDKIAKKRGLWLDKSHIILSIADKFDFNLVWHKTVLYSDSESYPQYMHYLCLSKTKKNEDFMKKYSSPSVILGGNKIYKNSFPMYFLNDAINFIKKEGKSKTVVDLFCGSGIVLAMANYFGLNSLGIDISEDQVKISKEIKITDEMMKNIKDIEKKNQELYKLIKAGPYIMDIDFKPNKISRSKPKNTFFKKKSMTKKNKK